MYKVNVSCIKFSDILAYFYALDTFIEIRLDVIGYWVWHSGWARSKRSAICSGRPKLHRHHYFRLCCPCGYSSLPVSGTGSDLVAHLAENLTRLQNQTKNYICRAYLRKSLTRQSSTIRPSIHKTKTKMSWVDFHLFWLCELWTNMNSDDWSLIM